MPFRRWVEILNAEKRKRGMNMARDALKFLTGVAAAMTWVHLAYAAAAKRGAISAPIWRGREWGIGKMLIEAVVYGTMTAGLGYLAWRPRTPELTR